MKNIIPTLGKCKSEEATKDFETNAVLAYGKAVVRESIKGYVTDDDVLVDEKNDAVDRLNTKKIRGIGKKKLAREKELKQAASLYAGR